MTQNCSDKTKKSLVTSIILLALCGALLIGATYAWFTDTASTEGNRIVAGTLKIDIASKIPDGYTTLQGKMLEWQTEDGRAQNQILWEPGATYTMTPFYVINEKLSEGKLSNLTLKYRVEITGITGEAKLLEALEFSITDENGTEVSLDDFNGVLEPNADGSIAADGPYVLTAHMKEDAGNEYQELSVEGIAITVYATQNSNEQDSMWVR